MDEVERCYMPNSTQLKSILIVASVLLGACGNQAELEAAKQENAQLKNEMATLRKSLSPATTEDPAADLRKEALSELGPYFRGIIHGMKGTGVIGSVVETKSQYAAAAGLDKTWTETRDGIIVTWYQPGANAGAVYPAQLKIVGRSLGMPFHTEFGRTTSSDIETAIGPPISAGKDAIEYHLPGHGGDDTLRFRFEKGVLHDVTVDLFID